jgi:cell division septal protein FtsQ
VVVAFVTLVLWPRFRVTSVVVDSSPSISAPKVESFIRERIAGAVLGLPRNSQFLLSTRSLEAQLRSALAETVTVQNLQVRRVWPSGLRVVIKEASGAFALTSGGDVFLLDANGRIVNRLAAVPGALFLLTDSMALGWAVGDTVLPAATLAGLSAFRQDLGAAGILTTSATIPEVSCYPAAPNVNVLPNANAEAAGDPCDRRELVRLTTDLTLTTAEGWQLEVALSGDRKRQISDLAQLLAERFRTGRGGLLFVDVRLPGRAYVRTR